MVFHWSLESLQSMSLNELMMWREEARLRVEKDESE